MSKAVSMKISIDPEIQASADGIFAHFGMTVADAVRIFLHKCVIVGGLPFDLTLPEYNDDTLAAVQEADDIINGRIPAKTYNSLQEILDEMNAEDAGD